MAVMTPVYLPTHTRQRVGNAHWSASGCVIRRHWWLSFSVSWADTLPAGHLVSLSLCVCVSASNKRQPWSSQSHCPCQRDAWLDVLAILSNKLCCPSLFPAIRVHVNIVLIQQVQEKRRERNLSSFTYLHVSTNLYLLLFFFIEHKRWCLAECPSCSLFNTMKMKKMHYKNTTQFMYFDAKPKRQK